MRATAIAHPMQALVKYHGLKDWNLRLPYHDSISVNLDALWTKTTVEFGDFEKDSITINDIEQDGNVLQRSLSVVDKIRVMADLEARVKIVSMNNLALGEVKGLGYSSSGGAALAAAAFKSAGLDSKYGLDMSIISRIARLLAGSACRSVIGEYSRWYAGKDDLTSFAEKIASKDDLDIGMIAVPLPSDFSTEEAHREVESSGFFHARIESVIKRVNEMERVIKDGSIEKVGELAELDSLELHALTMTGTRRMILLKPESLRLIQMVRKKRNQGLPVYFSMQTGPSVFINTYPENLEEILEEIRSLGMTGIRSGVGEGVRIVSD